MLERADVEASIADDEATLASVVQLIATQLALTIWPGPSREAFALAIGDPSLSVPECWKRTALRRHLYRDPEALPRSLAIPEHPTPADRRRAEYLRANLAAVVPFQSGVHLR